MLTGLKLVWFSCISTVVGHIMLNPVSTYIEYDLLTHFIDTHSSMITVLFLTIQLSIVKGK